MRKSGRRDRIRREDLELYSLMLPAAALILLFSYVPMWGIVIAFQNYMVGDPLFSLSGVRWVGLAHVRQFVGSMYFSRTLVNTMRLSLMNLLFGFTAPIAFALMLNELRSLRFKKFVQTASYMPYFISTVVVAGMALSFLEVNGMINNLLGAFGLPAREYIAYPAAYPWIYTATNVWKGFGFGSILYFSTISGIDQALYESARMDGASRWQQMRYITVPGIAYIIAVQLVLSIGHMLGTNTELALLLYRPSTYSTSDVIGTYVYRVGIQGGKYSYTAAVGLFMSIIGFGLTFLANAVSNRISGYGLW